MDCVSKTIFKTACSEIMDLFQIYDVFRNKCSVQVNTKVISVSKNYLTLAMKESLPIKHPKLDKRLKYYLVLANEILLDMKNNQERKAAV